jgi:hypothetical protein
MAFMRELKPKKASPARSSQHCPLEHRETDICFVDPHHPMASGTSHNVSHSSEPARKKRRARVSFAGRTVNSEPRTKRTRSDHSNESEAETFEPIVSEPASERPRADGTSIPDMLTLMVADCTRLVERARQICNKDVLASAVSARQKKGVLLKLQSMMWSDDLRKIADDSKNDDARICEWQASTTVGNQMAKAELHFARALEVLMADDEWEEPAREGPRTGGTSIPGMLLLMLNDCNRKIKRATRICRMDVLASAVSARQKKEVLRKLQDMTWSDDLREIADDSKNYDARICEWQASTTIANHLAKAEVHFGRALEVLMADDEWEEERSTNQLML